MKTLLIIAHSPSANTQKLTQCLYEGALSESEQSIKIEVKPPLQSGPEDLSAADALILFTPENLGYMSGALKDWFDRIYYPCLESKQGLPCSAIIRAGHDGTGTRRALETITTGLKWRWVQEIVTLKGDYQTQFEDECYELGAAMSCALLQGII